MCDVVAFTALGGNVSLMEEVDIIRALCRETITSRMWWSSFLRQNIGRALEGVVF